MGQFWNGEVLAAPNLITVCVDESQASEISGRLYISRLFPGATVL